MKRQTAKRGRGRCAIGRLSPACVGLLVAMAPAQFAAAEGPSASSPLPPGRPQAPTESVTTSIAHLCDMIGNSGEITAINGLGQPVASSGNTMTNLAVHLCQLSGAYDRPPRGLEPAGLPQLWREPAGLLGLGTATTESLPDNGTTDTRMPNGFQAEARGLPRRPPPNAGPGKPLSFQDDLVSQLLNSAGADTASGDNPYAMRHVPTYPTPGQNSDGTGYGNTDPAYGNVAALSGPDGSRARDAAPHQNHNGRPAGYRGESMPEWVLTIYSAMRLVRNSTELQYLIFAAILLGLSVSWYHNRKGN